MGISTHTPLTGRDVGQQSFCRACDIISTHTPLTGRDFFTSAHLISHHISTHTPLTGRDCAPDYMQGLTGDFYSHAPYGT